MKFGVFWTAFAALGIMTSAAAKEPFEALDVFELEIATDPQVSPDGTTIAYVRRSNDIMKDKARANIWTVTVEGRDHRPLLSGRDDYSSPRWSPSGDRLAYVTGAEGGSPQLYVRWMETGQTALLTNLAEAPGAISWSPDGRSLAFTMFVEKVPEPLAAAPAKPKDAQWAEPFKVIEHVTYRADGAGFLRDGHTHIFTVPADGGTPRQLTEGDYHHNGPLDWSVDGSRIFFSANRNDDWELDVIESDIWSVNVADSSLTQLTDRKGPDFSPRLSPDGGTIAYLGYDDKLRAYQTPVLHVMNIDGSDKRIVTSDLDRQIETIHWDSNASLIAQYGDHGRNYLARIDLDGAIDALVRDVSGTTLGRPYTSGQFNVGGGVIAYTTGKATRPADIAVMTPDARAKRLTRLNDDLLNHLAIGDAERIAWTSSADGKEMEGWIVKPPAFDPAKKYPLILEIHGGPHAAYGPHFAAEVQLFAAAGYVVFYANPRGSSTYGEAFGNLIHHNYPNEDYDDLISGVDAVIAQGYVDEDQLFVTGGSGGGVLTAWIVGKTDRFSAAVVAKPVINWASFTLTSDFYPFFYKYWFAQKPWEDPMAYWERSPLSLVGNVSTPTMLLTGEADYRTPMSESEQYYQALQILGVDTALVRVPDVSHSIAARPSNLIGKAAHILGWFERYRTEEEAAGDDSEANEG